MAIRERYEKALAPLGSFALVWIAKSGLSSVFVNLALKNRKGGRTIPGLLESYPPPDRAPITTLSLISYSAGYGLAREIFRSEDDRNALDAYVALDSVHSSIVAGRVPPRSFSPFTEYARLSKDGGPLFALSHTDVPTHGYASTSQVAAALVNELQGVGGNFSVRFVNKQPPSKPKAEHGGALVDWGPDYVAELLVPYLLSKPKPEFPPVADPVVPWQDPCLTLGERCVEFSLQEHQDGVTEVPPGSNGGPRIREYFAPATRAIRGVETTLGMGSGNWCVVGACFAAVNSTLPGDAPIPHLYRVSGIEAWDDAVRLGLSRPRALVKKKLWRPARGDCVVLYRGKRKTWERHFCRVIEPPNGNDQYKTIDANSGNVWRIRERSLADPKLIGFIEYPRPESATPDVDAARLLRRLSLDLEQGNQGIDKYIQWASELKKGSDGTG